MIGKLTTRTRKIKLINVLTKHEDILDVLYSNFTLQIFFHIINYTYVMDLGGFRRKHKRDFR